MFADYHTHTTFSHGTGTVADNVRAARAAGLQAVGIADHGPANWFGVGVADLTVFDAIRRQVQRCRRLYPDIRILAGTEANVISCDGKLDVPRAIQRRLDQILVGFHTQATPASFQDGWRFVSRSLLARLSHGWQRRVRAANTKVMVAAMAKNKIDLITHPGLKVPVDPTELGRASARHHVALEINARHGVESLDFIRAAARTGAVFALGSDAHRPEDVGRVGRAIRIAAEAGLDTNQIINVHPKRR